MHAGVPIAAFAPAVPEAAPVVVRSNASTRVLHVVVVACAVIVAAIAGLTTLMAWLVPATLPLLVVLPPLAVQLGFTVLIAREYRALLGPQLAADHTGVWVRTGLGRRPEVVYLPWAAVEGVDVTGKGPAVRILSRAGEELHGRRPHWRARSLRRRFGTTFVVDGRRSAEPVDRIAQRLWQTAQAAHSSRSA